MGFWEKVHSLNLQEFRPGIYSKAEMGQDLVMACMEIGRECFTAGRPLPNRSRCWTSRPSPVPEEGEPEIP